MGAPQPPSLVDRDSPAPMATSREKALFLQDSGLRGPHVTARGLSGQGQSQLSLPDAPEMRESRGGHLDGYFGRLVTSKGWVAGSQAPSPETSPVPCVAADEHRGHRDPGGVEARRCPRGGWRIPRPPRALLTPGQDARKESDGWTGGKRGSGPPEGRGGDFLGGGGDTLLLRDLTRRCSVCHPRHSPGASGQRTPESSPALSPPGGWSGFWTVLTN